MKILQILPDLGLGGAEILCETLTKELVRAGHSVVVVSLYRHETAIGRRLAEKGISVRYLDKRPGPDPAVIPRLRRVIGEEQPRLLHTHLHALKYAAAAAGAKGPPIVHTIHTIAGREGSAADRLLNRYFYRCCTRRIYPAALSEQVRRTVLEWYRLPESRVPLAANGVDLSLCRPRIIHHRPFTILHIGRFTPEKNHRELVRAFALFHRAHPESCLRLVGDGPLRRETEELGRSLGLGETLIFEGLQPEVHGFLQEADLFVLPSLYEGMPMTLLEAMGTGLPIAAAPVGGVPDLVQDGKTALFCKSDGESIAAAMERLFTDEELRETLGQGALAASVRFSAEAMTRRYLELYERALICRWEEEP